jgi:hypothetical protein
MDYNRILKIIKYNKYIQDKLGIDIQNYKTSSNYEIVKREYKYTFNFKEEYNCFFNNFILVIIEYLLLIYERYYIYSFVQSISFLGLEPLSYLYEKFFKLKSINTLVVIITYIFGFILIFIKYNLDDLMVFKYMNIILIIYLILFLIFKYMAINFNKYMSYFGLIFISILIFVCCLYFILLPWRISIEFKLKIYGSVCQEIVFIYYSVHIIQIYFETLKEILYAIKNNKTFTILVKYKDIDTEYLLPENFEKMENKRKYLNSICDNFRINYGNNINKLTTFNIINNYRIKNKLQKLTLSENIPYCILHEATNILMSDEEIFGFGKDQYLLKYKIGNHIQFLNEYPAVLLIQNLNMIIVFKQKGFEYVMLFDSNKLG